MIIWCLSWYISSSTADKGAAELTIWHGGIFWTKEILRFFDSFASRYRWKYVLLGFFWYQFICTYAHCWPRVMRRFLDLITKSLYACRHIGSVTKINSSSPPPGFPCGFNACFGIYIWLNMTNPCGQVENVNDFSWPQHWSNMAGFRITCAAMRTHTEINDDTFTV